MADNTDVVRTNAEIQADKKKKMIRNIIVLVIFVTVVWFVAKKFR